MSHGRPRRQNIVSRSGCGFLIVVGQALLWGCTPPEPDEAINTTAESTTTQAALTGENLGGANLAASNLGGTNLAGLNLAGSNLGGTNLGGANLAGANLGGANLGGANLGGANMSGTNLGGTNLAGANIAGANLAAGLSLATSSLCGDLCGGSTPGSYTLRGTPVSGTYRLSGYALDQPGVAMNIHSASTPVASGLLFSGEDVFDKSKSNVVLGIGSRAFSRLIADNVGYDNSTSGTMSCALRKTNFGLKGTSAAYDRDAWEAVVWGPSSYAVFVIMAPKNSTWEGVAGFVKTIWRWHAVPSKTLQVGQINAGKTVQRWTGMMGAGHYLLNNEISDKNFIAGEMAFAAATTNTVAVNVDFASWVTKVDGTRLLLGNVSGTPSYTDGEFMAGFENSDGELFVTALTKPWYALSQYPYKSSTVVQSSNWLLYDAYNRYLSGKGAKPVAKRCLGALFLKATYNVAIPAGKCDETIASSTGATSRWAGYSVEQTETVPYAQIPFSSRTGVSTNPVSADVIASLSLKLGTRTATIVSGTTVHLNETPF